MKKHILTIIFGIVAVAFVTVSAVEYVMWNNDKDYYEAQLSEYQTAVQSLTSSVNGTSSDLSDANKSITEFKNQITQMQSDLDAYKKVVDEINAEREEKAKALEEKKKAEEEEWNALSDAQKTAITEGKERARVVAYLLKTNEEYVNLYSYMNDLASKGLVELSSKEYKVYKANKTRMNELEAECRKALEAENNATDTENKGNE